MNTDLFVPLTLDGKHARRQSLGWNTDRTIAIVPRRWAPTKGVIFAAQAMSSPQWPANCDVVFAGAGESDFPEYSAQIRRVLDASPVGYRIIDSLSMESMALAIQGADFCIIPSLMEATSLSALEAMSAGLPVVATTVGGLPEIIDEGVNGYLVPPMDPDAIAVSSAAVCSLTPAERYALGQTSRERISTAYSWGGRCAADDECVHEGNGMRIAYVSHVDSRWIKQRPHFIAESMQRDSHKVTYVCSGLVRGEFLVRTQDLSVPVVRIPLLPQRFRGRLRALDPVTSAISAFIILLRIRPHAVVFTHSRHFRLARHVRRMGVRVFYDCMDLNGLFSDATTTEKSDERDLVTFSERTFCSSERIADHIRALLPGAPVDIISNALNPGAFEGLQAQAQPFVSNTIGYVGAISTWFDFDTILALVNARPNLSVRLWGPCDVAIPAHDRIEHMGIVSHELAIKAMQSCSLLLLPFRVTDLIRAVDPVKVYEYVATGRPVVTCDYPQLQHFGNLINRYRSSSELIEIVDTLLDSPSLSRMDVSEFISSNSWAIRAEKMLKTIE
ncbi:glycosyltransferase family 4 protein [Arthrobacter sp. 92]|uniref:glycosyltransferase family 4 protein n=1 Tax=Arthrobacter sp. 92 TaxID=3418175 RepID=UPI003D07823D